jgi:excisionase family DNA binding protein
MRNNKEEKMKDKFFSVDDIAEILDMHPKTIQRYIREGKIKGTKLGKSWKVTGHDLSVFTESEERPDIGLKAEQSQNDKLEVKKITGSSVIDINVSGSEEAMRIVNTLNAVLSGKLDEYGYTNMSTQYIQPEQKLRVTLWGKVKFLRDIMDLIGHYDEVKGS